MLLLCRLQSQTCSRRCATLWLGCATCMHCCMLARPRRDTCINRMPCSCSPFAPSRKSKRKRSRAPNGCPDSTRAGCPKWVLPFRLITANHWLWPFTTDGQAGKATRLVRPRSQHSVGCRTRPTLPEAKGTGRPNALPWFSARSQGQGPGSLHRNLPA